MRTRSGIALLGSALVLLLAAWVFVTPPFAAPDEAAHYLRALSIANGRLLGPKVPYFAPTGEQTAWVLHDVRGVLVPALLSPPNYPCLDGRPDVRPRGCLEPTYTGDYEPLPYLLPALAIDTTGRVQSALWLARIASALPCLAFLLLALVLLWSGSAWSVLGLLAATTPMALFIGSVINPNGLEIAANLAFAAGVLRISRRPIVASPRWVWVALAASGAVAVLAWQLGWLFVLSETVLLAALLGREGWQVLTFASGRELRATVLVLLAAAGVYLIFGVSSGLLHGDFGVTPVGASLHQGLDQLRQTLYGAVGVFGALIVGLPSGSYWVWWLLVLALVGGALAWSGQRERVVMLAMIVLALAFPVLFYAWVFRHSGFGLQARYVMPMLALIPLLGGELIFRSDRRRLRTTWSWLPPAAVAVVAGFQLFSWWINARHWAIEPNGVWFLSHPRWSPPGGWWPWTVAAMVGASALLAFAASELRARDGQAFSRTVQRVPRAL